MLCVVSCATTWSRVRHSESGGQRTLRSLTQSSGMDGNAILKFAAWIVEQALHCTSSWRVATILIFPRDFGGHVVAGPTCLWALGEFPESEGHNDAHWDAGFRDGMDPSNLGSYELDIAHVTVVPGLAALSRV